MHRFASAKRRAPIHYSVMPLYKLHETKFSEVPKTTFAGEHIREKIIREAIRDFPQVLGEELLIICEEFAQWEGSSRSIDLLAIDPSGNLVIIELKRTSDGGHAELQAIRYAGMANSMTFKEVVAIYQTFLQKRGRAADAASEIYKFVRSGLYVLKNQGSGKYLPLLEELARQHGMVW